MAFGLYVIHVTNVSLRIARLILYLAHTRSFCPLDFLEATFQQHHLGLARFSALIRTQFGLKSFLILDNILAPLLSLLVRILIRHLPPRTTARIRLLLAEFCPRCEALGELMQYYIQFLRQLMVALGGVCIQFTRFGY